MLRHYLALLPIVSVASVVPLLGVDILRFTFHQGLHVLSMGLAVFLAALAFLAFKNDGRRRFLFLGGAFSIFMANEMITLAAGFLAVSEPMVPLINDPLRHTLNLFMLSLFAGGVFVGDRRRNGIRPV